MAVVASSGGIAAGSVGTVIFYGDARRPNLSDLPSPSARKQPTYLHQVRRIAPPRLLDREAELAELNAFCAQEAQTYVWWRAPEWSGKTALMAWFVLHPPQDVDVVSFFITARLAAQDNRAAFTEVMLGELTELLGERMAPGLTEATREAYLHALLARAAENSQRGGRRLVLVVDGLDEDRGLTSGPDAHSIAALLPAEPPNGMRVIVAGRLNPPIPSDVPTWHPLRNAIIVRPLAQSRHAHAIRADAERSLEQLVSGSAIERRILGLVATARGGLSISDITEIIGDPKVTSYHIRRVLTTVSGRSFTPRPSSWRPIEGPEVYLLAHEQLQVTALEMLGQTQMEEHRQELHAWADSYRLRHWPLDTPEYLLFGYYAFLRETSDGSRLIAYALDDKRHDRMLDISGGDTAAMIEVRNALDIIGHQELPNLSLALQLAYHRQQLLDRNRYIPPTLPPVWASVGNIPRAMSLAQSIATPEDCALALTKVANILSLKTGDTDAGQLAGKAKDIARQIRLPDQRAEVLAAAVTTMVALGQLDQAVPLVDEAEAAVRQINDPGQRARAFAAAVEAAAAVGQLDQAGRLADEMVTIWRTIRDPGLEAWVLVRVIRGLVAGGQISKAVVLARGVSFPDDKVQLLAEVVEALAAAGHLGRARQLAREARELTRLDDLRPEEEAQVLSRLASAFAAIGQVSDTSELANEADVALRKVQHLEERGQVLAKLTRSLAIVGERHHAVRFAAKGRATAAGISNAKERASVLAEIADALAIAGYAEEAIRVAAEAEIAGRNINAIWQQAWTFALMAQALASADHTEEALRVAAEAETAARLIKHAEARASVFMSLVQTLASIRQGEAATRVAIEARIAAREISASWERATMITSVAIALTQANQFTEAEAMARHVGDPSRRVLVLTRLVRATAVAGQVQRAAELATKAENIARHIANPWERRDSLVMIAEAAADAGLASLASRLAIEVETRRGQVGGLSEPGGLLVDVSARLASAGRFAEAEELACRIDDRGRRSYAFAKLGTQLAVAGHLDKSNYFLHEADSNARAIADHLKQSWALVEIARAWAHAGQFPAARMVAQGIAAAVPRSKAFAWIAQVLVTAGRFGEAREVLTEIASSEEKVIASLSLLEAWAKAGEVEQVSQLIAEMGNNAAGTAPWISARMAEALAVVGRFDEARAIADDIKDTRIRHDVLAVITRASVAAGRIAYAWRIAAHACAAEPWRASLVLVAESQPAAVIEAARKLMFVAVNGVCGVTTEPGAAQDIP